MFNQIFHDDVKSDDEFGLKKSIKIRFEFDFSQNFTPGRFNCLGLLETYERNLKQRVNVTLVEFQLN